MSPTPTADREIRARGALAAAPPLGSGDCPLEALREVHFLQRQICLDAETLADTTTPRPVLALAVLTNQCRDLPLHHADEDEGLFPLLRQRALEEDEIDRLLTRLSAVYGANAAAPLHQTLSMPAPCLCDAAAGALLPVEVALARALALAGPVAGSEALPLHAATGRITAAPVASPVPLPPFDNAAMDGYALDPDALVGPGPWVLPVAGRARAGDAPAPCPPGGALRILTGAAIPPGVGAVVPQEEVTRQGGTIVLRRRPAPGTHIRRAGEDLSVGARMLPAGRAIGPREAGALAAMGQAQVAVRRRVRVAILSTGSELVEPGGPLAPGQIWNSNRAQLTAALALPYVDLIDLGPIPDQPARIAVALRQAAEQADLIVTTGGVSVGDEDHTTRLVQAAGGTVHAMKLAMKPGKPLTVGTLGGAVWLGLPGNPVAAFVTWMVLGAPVLRALAGLSEPVVAPQPARLATGVRHKPGRCEYRPARRAGLDAGGLALIDCLADAGSHRVAQLAGADGLALIPAEASDLAAGDRIAFLPF